MTSRSPPQPRSSFVLSSGAIKCGLPTRFSRRLSSLFQEEPENLRIRRCVASPKFINPLQRGVGSVTDHILKVGQRKDIYRRWRSWLRFYLLRRLGCCFVGVSCADELSAGRRRGAECFHTRIDLAAIGNGLVNDRLWLTLIGPVAMRHSRDKLKLEPTEGRQAVE